VRICRAGAPFDGAILTLIFASVVAPASSASAQQRSSLRSAVFVRQAATTRLSGAPGTPLVALQPRRRAERIRIALQFVAASVGAVSGGFAGYSALRDVGETRVSGDATYTRSGNVGYLLGSLVGTTLGAHVVGTHMGGRAPLWATTLGGLIGSAPLLLGGVDEPYLPLFGIAVGWIPQAAFATGGFNRAESR
jgi:hypothetical protein